MLATQDQLKASNGVQVTQGLFYEFGNKDAPYTLKQYDFDTYKSVYLVYMSAVDEYDAAMQLVNSLDHWRKLCNLNWFMEGKPQGSGDNITRLTGLRQWREDMKLRDASTAKRQLLDQANNGSVPAQRILLDMSKAKPVKAKQVQQESGSITDLSKRFKQL